MPGKPKKALGLLTKGFLHCCSILNYQSNTISRLSLQFFRQLPFATTQTSPGQQTAESHQSDRSGFGSLVTAASTATAITRIKSSDV
jgi:hypothetical protein